MNENKKTLLEQELKRVNDIIIGKVRRVRSQKGMNQKMFAYAVGISPKQLCEFESDSEYRRHRNGTIQRAKDNPRLLTIIKMLYVLEISLANFFTEEQVFNSDFEEVEAIEIGSVRDIDKHLPIFKMHGTIVTSDWLERIKKQFAKQKKEGYKLFYCNGYFFFRKSL